MAFPTMMHEPATEASLQARGIPLERIKQRGHVAIFLTNYMQQHGMAVRDFNEHVLGVKRSSTAAYPWLNCHGSPIRKSAETLTAVMGVPLEFWAARALEDTRPVAMPRTAMVPATWRREASRGPGRGQPPKAAQEPLQAMVTYKAPRTPRMPQIALEALQAPAQGHGRDTPVPDGLRYISHGDGTVTISVCARLRVEHARPLFRTLMDAGLDGVGTDDDGDKGDG